MNEEALTRLAGVRRIVVHGGLAHLDDIMSCAMAYAFGVPHDAPIERRNPKPAELEDCATLVLDVGGRHDPGRLDFDHHQRARTKEPKCAFRLFAEWLELDEEMRTLFPWYTAWNLMDVCGPTATARKMGTTADALAGFIDNPLGDWVVRRFADDPVLRQKLALTLGRELALTRTCWRKMGPKIVRRTIAGLPVADLTACLTEEISRCSNAWVRLNHPACLLTRDGRGEGYSLVRCNDDPRLDFARCIGKPYTLFAHPGGFILKTRSKEDDLEVVLADARTDAR
ncbi:MAG: MYG1 family protein [Kiritimatiellia bacterium]